MTLMNHPTGGFLEEIPRFIPSFPTYCTSKSTLLHDSQHMHSGRGSEMDKMRMFHVSCPPSTLEGVY